MKNNKLNRRDFIKLGGLAAISLPSVKIIGKDGDYTFMESEDAFGGFAVKQLAKDEAPYVVANDYQRFDAQNNIFGRLFRDPKIREIEQGTVPMGTPDQPGWRHEDVALNAASWTIADYDHTAASFTDKHAGLLSVEPLNTSVVAPLNPILRERWDHSAYTEEDLANMIKKAGLFYGASLVGIAELDERWIYARYSDTFGPGGGDIRFTDVEEVELPEGTVSPREAKHLVQEGLAGLNPDDLKVMIVNTTEETDPALIPSDAPPLAMLKAMPPSQFVSNLGLMMSTMPTQIVQVYAQKLGLELEIALVDPGESASPRYLDDGSLAIPKSMQRVIVLAMEMDFDGMDAQPTPLGQAASGDGYSRGTFAAAHLAEYIRYLGYNAIPAVNQTGLSVPQAIDAGLGELGRMGILITPKYGPRVRLAKVITDMPLATDSPIKFGVKEFCDVCGKCAEYCPSNAILFEDQTMEAINISTSPGVMKWPIDSEKCFAGWKMAGGDCGNCITVCPFNKPEGWLHEITRILIGAESGAVDKLLLKLDDASGYGSGGPKIEKFWKSDDFIHIKPD